MKKFPLTVMLLLAFSHVAWATVPPAGSPEITLFFSSSGHGEYEPCG